MNFARVSRETVFLLWKIHHSVSGVRIKAMNLVLLLLQISKFSYKIKITISFYPTVYGTYLP